MQLEADTIARAHERSIVDVAIALGAADGVRVAERGVPCPGCGGKDRFSVDPDKNVFLCRMSGAAGDPIALVRHVHGISFAEAVTMLTGESALPAGKAQPRQENNEYRDRARRRAWKIWREGRSTHPDEGGRLVAAYLRLRGIPVPGWRIAALREIEELAYWHWFEDRREFAIVHKGPAMLAAITGPDGHFIGLHRTWLDLNAPDGKAEIFHPATGEMLPSKKVEGSQKGGRINLRPHGGSDLHMAIGEGIETVLAWNVLRAQPDAALIAGINLGNIAGRAAGRIPHPSRTMTDTLGRKRRQQVPGPDPLPGDVDCLQLGLRDCDRLTLLGDADGDAFATEAAMQRAQTRFSEVGIPTMVDWPRPGRDWNDELRAVLAARAEGAPAEGRAA